MLKTKIVNHEKVITGYCKICGHYGDDCTGQKQSKAPTGYRDFEFAEIITRRVRIPASMSDPLEYINCLDQGFIEDMEIVNRKFQGNHLSGVTK